jgi:hypothetical protein
MRTTITVIIACLSAAFSVSTAGGCNKDKTTSEYVPSSINITKSSLTLEVGETEEITASVVPAVANQPAFQWSSSDNAVATVSNGIVKAVGVGTATISVSYKGVSKAVSVIVLAGVVDDKLALLYNQRLNKSNMLPELLLNGVGQYTTAGLNVTGKGNVVKLDKFYAVAERKVQYRVTFSADAKAIFRSSEGDFNAYIDVAGKKISIATDPSTEKAANFLQADREYLVEIYHVYQQAKLRVVDVASGEAVEVTATHDGQGGVGQGVIQKGFSVGMQWDHYCFGLTSGSFMLVKKITVYALKKKVKLMLYGDSITQPEGYFPNSDFSQAWTQQIIERMGGDAMSSGRGGAQIDMVLGYIKNELPFIKAKYVMVTIGTNGGNTEAKLSELVDYIKSQGAIPILNNIPSNESGTQVDAAALIGQVRSKYGIKGSRFDVATSLNGDGKEVDKSTMYWEDYTGSYGWQIYHHPNEKGGKKMFEQTLIDVPEIYM